MRRRRGVPYAIGDMRKVEYSAVKATESRRNRVFGGGL